MLVWDVRQKVWVLRYISEGMNRFTALHFKCDYTVAYTNYCSSAAVPICSQWCWEALSTLTRIFVCTFDIKVIFQRFELTETVTHFKLHITNKQVVCMCKASNDTSSFCYRYRSTTSLQNRWFNSKLQLTAMRQLRSYNNFHRGIIDFEFKFLV